MYLYLNLLAVCYLAPHRVSTHPPNKVFYLVVDGLKWNYIDQYKTQAPNLRAMVRRGVRADSMIPTFPTVTCASLTTLFTGTHAQKHGVMGNFYYDPNLKQRIVAPCRNLNDWLNASQAEMLPITAAKNGVKYGMVPSELTEFALSTNQRIKKAVIKFVEDDLDIMINYVGSIDVVGHKFGPDSPEMADSIRKLDRTIGSLFRYLRCRRMLHRVNVIIVSDHGMAPADPVNKVIRFEECVDVNDVEFVSPSPSATIFLKNDGMVEMTYEALKNCHKNWTVYRKEDIPERFKYKNNDRVGPIFVMADEGWQITYPFESPEPTLLYRGQHGYDNTLPSMGASFLASGPNFKRSYRQPKFHMVDVVPLVTKLLGIQPPANIDGSTDAFEGALRNI